MGVKPSSYKDSSFPKTRHLFALCPLAWLTTRQSSRRTLLAMIMAFLDFTGPPITNDVSPECARRPRPLAGELHHGVIEDVENTLPDGQAAGVAISVISGSIGTALAGLHGPVHWGHFVMTILGITLLHAGANVINDYFDYRNKVDTQEVPGSYATEGRVLIQKQLQPHQVLLIGLTLSGLSLPSGSISPWLKGLSFFFWVFSGS